MIRETSPKDWAAICWHEAGHAVVALARGLTVRRASVMSVPDADGTVGRVICARRKFEHEPPSRLTAHAAAALGGWLASSAGALGLMARESGDSSCGRDDLRQAAKALAHHPRCKGHRSALALLDAAEELAERTLSERWEAVRATAQQLDHRSSLSGSELRAILADPESFLADGWRTPEAEEMDRATYQTSAQERERFLMALEELSGGPLPPKRPLRVTQPRTPRVPKLARPLRTENGTRPAGMMRDGTFVRPRSGWIE